MKQHLLVTRPEYDYTTRYISAWAKISETSRTKGYAVIDLNRKRANRKEFESVVKRKKPTLVV